MRKPCGGSWVGFFPWIWLFLLSSYDHTGFSWTMKWGQLSKMQNHDWWKLYVRGNETAHKNSSNVITSFKLTAAGQRDLWRSSGPSPAHSGPPDGLYRFILKWIKRFSRNEQPKPFTSSTWRKWMWSSHLMEYSENKHYSSYLTILKYLMPIYDILYIFLLCFQQK